LTVVAAAFPVFAVGAVGPQLRADLGFGRAALGAAIGACQLASAASAWSLGRRVIAHGPTRAMRASAVLSCIALAGIAVSGGWLPLTGCLACCGLANAVGQPATNALLAGEVASGRRGRAFGIKMAAIPLGSMLAGAVVPVIAVPFGWRPAIALGAVLPVLALLVVRSTHRRRAAETPPAELPAPDTARPVLVLLAVGVGLVIAATTSLPAFFVDGAVASGLTETTAGACLAAGGLAGVVARLLVGRAVDRRARASVDIVVAMMLAGVVGFALLTRPGPALQVVGLVVVFALGWGWVGLFQYLLVGVNPSNPGAATGITDTGGYLGATIGPIVIGVIADQASFGMAWAAAAVAAAAGAAFVFAGARVADRDGEPVELRPCRPGAERPVMS
jgi:predicted MFS family arabinose efflux permease